MFPFLFSGIGLKLAVAGVAIAAVVSAWLYVTGLQKEVKQLELNNQIVTTELEEQKAIIVQKEREAARVRRDLQAQLQLTEVLAKEVGVVTTKFNKLKADGTKRDFGQLAVKKTETIERLINRGTKKAFDCLESITGNEEVNSDCLVGTTPISK